MSNYYYIHLGDFKIKVAVIGSGIGGLTVASLLAKENFTVDLYEQNSKCGGKMFCYTNDDGLIWDTGPTLISLPNEIRNTFSYLQVSSPEMCSIHTGCRVLFSDGSDWILPNGKEKLIKYFTDNKICKFNEFEKLMETSEKFFDFAEKYIFDDDPPKILNLGFNSLKLGILFRNPKISLMPYSKLVDKYISNSNLREFLYHFSSYVGMNPDLAQAGIISIAHVELNSEVVFPKGGVYSIARCLIGAADKLNIRIFTNSEVVNATPILNEINMHAWNLTISKNSLINNEVYDLVVSNCDPYVSSETWLNNNKIKNNFENNIKSNKMRASESQFVILFDWENHVPISHHLKIFPKSWRKSFIDVCEKLEIPEDPCIYLVWPHATDSSVSPRILFISAMAPNNLSGITWSEEFSQNYAEKILNICRKRLKLSFEGKIFKIVTPFELEKRAKSYKGGIYSATYSKFNPTGFHFSGLTEFQNLYFVGAGVHPGAGVSMVMKSARRIAQHIIQKFKYRI